MSPDLEINCIRRKSLIVLRRRSIRFAKWSSLGSSIHICSRPNDGHVLHTKLDASYHQHLQTVTVLTNAAVKQSRKPAECSFLQLRVYKIQQVVQPVLPCKRGIKLTSYGKVP